MTKLSSYEREMRDRARADREVTKALRAAVAEAMRHDGSNAHDRAIMVFGWMLGHVTDKAEREMLSNAILKGMVLS